MSIENPNQPNNTESTDQIILEKMNERLQTLNYSSSKLPEDQPEYESLKKQKVVMLDDNKDEIYFNFPHLCRATNGKADFIFHQTENTEALINKVLELDPDYLLLDHRLNIGISGPEVAKQLLESGFQGKIVGFSSDSSEQIKNSFMDAGVQTCIQKTINGKGNTLALAKFAANQPVRPEHESQA